VKPKVTVVIPTINRESLPIALASVNDQSFRGFKLIIIDDSQDQSVESTIYQVIKTGGLKGVSKARNLGIAHSESDFTALLDDDDFWHRDYLAKQISNFKELQIDFGLTGAIVNGHNRPKNTLKIGESPFELLYGKHHLLRSPSYLPTSAYMFRTEIFKMINFDETISDRENLKFIWESFKIGCSIHQDSKSFVTINYSKKSSLSRINLAQEIDWSCYLKTFNEDWSQNFIVESVRNFIRFGDRKSANILISMLNPEKKFLLKSFLKLMAL